jgi:DNA primase
MAIPDEDVARVRAATDMVALVGEHVALRRSGRRWVGLCPFHAERTPSFNVNAEEGFYYCWGCHASGDAITFVRATEHVDFVDAVRILADRAGITIHEDAQGGAERKRRAMLLDAMERAVAWYHDRLLSAPDAGPARDYLRSRGYDGEIVRRFRLGWAPDDWDALSRSLEVPERVLTDAALGFVNRRGRVQDAFRARVVFPICDPSGRPVALGGRILPPPGVQPPPSKDEDGPHAVRRSEPKYKNSSETAIYSKRRTLYALNWAKENIVATGEVVVCEGYTDVIGFFTAGVPRAVATCGTALAEEHFTLLRNFGKRIVLAYDADAAGQSAVDRVYEWERRHEVEVAVAALPPGTDPGDLARTDPEALRHAVADARPFLQFRVDRVFAAADLSTVEGRARAAETALDAVAEHPDDLVRDQYVMQVADRARLDPALARERLTAARRRRPGDRSGARGGRASSGRPGPGRPSPLTSGGSDEGGGTRRDPRRHGRASSGVEGDGGSSDEVTTASVRQPAAADRPGLEALRLAVHRRSEVTGRLDEVLFVDDVQRRAYRALASSHDLHEAVERAPADVAQLLRRVAVEEPVTVSDPLADPVDSVVAQLVRRAARSALDNLQAVARTSPDDLGELAAETATVRRWLGDLDDPAGARVATDRLVAWLVTGTRRVDGSAGPEAAFTRGGGD